MTDLPRVSTILRILDDAYAGVPQAAMEKAAERGEALHRICLSYLASRGGMCASPADIPEEFRAAYHAFVKWCEDNEVYPVAVEQADESTKYKFKGTPDALILFGPHDIVRILDLKFTASILRVNKVQIQAYWRLDMYSSAEHVMLLHIKPITGELKAHKVAKNPHDWAAFLNALSIYRWRQS